jgi:hypothetical protein
VRELEWTHAHMQGLLSAGAPNSLSGESAGPQQLVISGMPDGWSSSDVGDIGCAREGRCFHGSESGSGSGRARAAVAVPYIHTYIHVDGCVLMYPAVDPFDESGACATHPPPPFSILNPSTAVQREAVPGAVVLRAVRHGSWGGARRAHRRGRTAEEVAHCTAFGATTGSVCGWWRLLPLPTAASDSIVPIEQSRAPLAEAKKKRARKRRFEHAGPSVPPYWFSSLASAVGTRCEVHCNDVAMAVITGTAAWLDSG